MPPIPIKCDDGADIVKYLQGYSLGYAYYYSTAQLKQILTRMMIGEANRIIIYGRINIYTSLKPVCTIGQYPSTTDCKCAAGDTKSLSGPPDCSNIKKDTPKEYCECPERSDKEKWDADPRTADSKGICASESLRVFLSVITADVVLPALALFV
ncbi:MAG: hypothetical protein EZS28_001871 [Streblomastix strix]|uniref:Uncharacterized protein n=1 Tax=Streblomastix strix TaxID=222440 RepID=A0A5J4X7K4_9EUKA|nr:MAG: hypothetical protein EZS28_001871 [Streblomastix strix]